MSTENKNASIWEDFFHYSANRHKVIPDGTTVGVANATAYKSALINILHMGYKYSSESMKVLSKNADAVSDEVKNDYFAAVRALISLIGEVNGDTLNTKAIADLLLAKTFKLDSAPMCLTEEGAHCWNMLRESRKVVSKSDDPTPEQLAEVESWKAEYTRLNTEGGHFRDKHVIVSESVFIKNATAILSNSINEQFMIPIEDVIAAKAARKQALKDKRAARKSAKK
jgi:hypothetical protein